MSANVVQCIRSGERGGGDCQNRRLVNREGVNQRSTCKGSVNKKNSSSEFGRKQSPTLLILNLHLIGMLLEPL